MIKSTFIFLLSVFFLITFFFPSLIIAQKKPIVIPLWPNGAPGFENRRNERDRQRITMLKICVFIQQFIHLLMQNFITHRAIISQLYVIIVKV